jgi:hypothetical protein
MMQPALIESGKVCYFLHAMSAYLYRIPQSTGPLNCEALAYELVISGIANLLKNNGICYKRFCLERCYDPDVRLRVMFMKAFTRGLRSGTQFDPSQVHTSRDSLHTLCRVSYPS